MCPKYPSWLSVTVVPSFLPKGNPEESCSLHKQLAPASKSSRNIHASVYFHGNLALSFRGLKTQRALNNRTCAALKSQALRTVGLKNEISLILNKHPSFSPATWMLLFQADTVQIISRIFLWELAFPVFPRHTRTLGIVLKAVLILCAPNPHSLTNWVPLPGPGLEQVLLSIALPILRQALFLLFAPWALSSPWVTLVLKYCHHLELIFPLGNWGLHEDWDLICFIHCSVPRVWSQP